MFYLIPAILFLLSILIYTSLTSDFDFSIKLSEYNITEDSDEKSNVELIRDTLSLLKFRYQVGDHVQNPYAGGGFTTNENFLNFKKYDYLELTLDSYETNDFRIILTDFINSFSDKDKNMTHMYNLYDLSVQKGLSIYKIPLKDFSVPGWWFKIVNIKAEQIPKEEGELGRISGVLFYNHPLTQANVENRFTLLKIRLLKAYSVLWIITILIIFIYLIAIKSILILFQKNKPALNYKKIDAGIEKRDNDTDILFSFISENYANPDLNLNVIVTKTGISEVKIRALIKTIFDKNLRQYINDIRITEARRLLLETKLQIKEIAYKVGYRHISSFNRAFGLEEDLSPAEYREKNQMTNLPSN